MKIPYIYVLFPFLVVALVAAKLALTSASGFLFWEALYIELLAGVMIHLIIENQFHHRRR